MCDDHAGPNTHRLGVCRGGGFVGAHRAPQRAHVVLAMRRIALRVGAASGVRARHAHRPAPRSTRPERREPCRLPFLAAARPARLSAAADRGPDPPPPSPRPPAAPRRDASPRARPRRAPTRVVATLAASGAATAILAPRRVVAGSHTTDAHVPEDAVHPEDADVEDAAPPRVVAFFDLDHTIIDTNSNKHWVSREVLAGRVTPKLIGLAIYWFTRYAMGQGAGAEAAGAEAAMAYAGKSERQLRTEVETMFDEKLAHRMRPGCGPTMAEHVARGDLCVMCTSSWQYAAQYAARLFGCETAPRW